MADMEKAWKNRLAEARKDNEVPFTNVLIHLLMTSIHYTVCPIKSEPLLVS